MMKEIGEDGKGTWGSEDGSSFNDCKEIRSYNSVRLKGFHKNSSMDGPFHSKIKYPRCSSPVLVTGALSKPV